MPTAPHYLLFAQTNAHESGGRWRFVLDPVQGQDCRRFEASADESAREDRLALLAVVRGLEALDQPSRVTLMSGSAYVNRGLRYGLRRWYENDWCWEKFGELEEIQNADLWRRVARALEYHQVEVRGWLCESARDDLQSSTKQWRVDRPHAVEPVGEDRGRGARRRHWREAVSVAAHWLTGRQKTTHLASA
ncbi:MAG: hypothetical protein QGG36_06460 [Pirellulaceae bacterium]|jgi:ribonuclease HI|nr:hypothetical protein [Pirellulaceae bacterium]